MRFPRKDGAERASWWLVSAAAIGLHAGLILLGAFVAPPGLSRARTPSLEADPIEVAVDVAPPDRERRAEPEQRQREAATSTGASRAEDPLGRAREGRPETAPPVSTSEPGPSSPSRPGGEYDPLPGDAPRLPGLGGVPAWAVPGVIAPPERPAPAPTTTPRARFDPRAADRALRGTLDARDHERGLGLPAANEAKLAIEAVVESSETPSESTATFDVDVDAAGNITNISMPAANRGGAAMWARVLARIKQSLAGRKLTMRGDAATAGAHLRVRVETRERYPNGRKPGENGRGTNMWGEHASRVVLAKIDVVVPGQKPLPENIKPIVDQPFFRPPDPQKSGVVPLTPAEAYRLHTPQQ